VFGSGGELEKKASSRQGWQIAGFAYFPSHPAHQCAMKDKVRRLLNVFICFSVNSAASSMMMMQIGLGDRLLRCLFVS
jgi:hypothetical protein